MASNCPAACDCVPEEPLAIGCGGGITFCCCCMPASAERLRVLADCAGGATCGSAMFMDCNERCTAMPGAGAATSGDCAGTMRRRESRAVVDWLGSTTMGPLSGKAG